MPNRTATLVPKNRPIERTTQASPKSSPRPDRVAWSRFVAAAGRIRIGAGSTRRG